MKYEIQNTKCKVWRMEYEYGVCRDCYIPGDKRLKP